MRLSEFLTYRVRIPFRVKFGHAAAVRECSDSVIVRLAATDGAVGLGESAPREYVTGETAETVLKALESSGPQLTAALAEGKDAMEFLRAELPALLPGNAARCAFELAALDLVSKSARTSIPDLLGRKGLPGFRPRYSGVIGSGSRFKLAASALKMRLYGFRDVKIKVGISLSQDAAAAHISRFLLGRRTDIRADANGAWTLDEAQRTLDELSAFDISCIEQPLPKDRNEDLPLLRRKTPVPIMLDESLCTMEDAHRAVTRGECELFNLRISKCGGLITTLDLADYAKKNGIKCQLGCQVGETGILSAAGRMFSAMVPELLHLEGSYERHLLSGDVTRERVRFGYGGWADPLAGPGFGVSAEESALRKFAEHVSEVRL